MDNPNLTTKPSNRRRALTGVRFSKLVVQSYAETLKSTSANGTIRSTGTWLCICDCGREKICKTLDLTSGNVRSCGCLSGPYRIDLTGHRSGRLVVLRHVRNERYDGGSRVWWLCQCDCGNEIEVRGDAIRGDAVHSCGCIGREWAIQMGYANRGRVHTAEHIEKFRQARLANPTPSPMLGKKHSPETIAKIRATKIRNGDSVGERNPAWSGGVSRKGYPHVFNSKLKVQIRERDGYVCVLCGCTQAEEKEELGRSLCVNHIDFDKSNCDPSNLNTLCLRCNCRINADRPRWTKYFQEQQRNVA